MFVGQPVFRTSAFQVPDGVFVIVALHAPVQFGVPHCTEIEPKRRLHRKSNLDRQPILRQKCDATHFI